MFLDAFLNSFVALFVIIDPIGIAPIFLGISAHSPKNNLKQMAIRGTLIAFFVMLFFGAFGEFILHKLGITIEAFKIAGGALLFIVAFNMIMKDSEPPHDSISATSVQHSRDWSVFPLAIPLLAGPGSITTIILLMVKAHDNLSVQIATFLALFATCVIGAIAMLCSERISAFLGSIGTNVFSRVLGIILAALAVQYVADGIKVIFAL